MRKNILLMLLAMLVVLFVFSGKKSVEEPAEEGAAPKIAVEEKHVKKNPDTFIYATHGTIDSLNSANTYDSASWTVMATIYETLVYYDGAGGRAGYGFSFSLEITHQGMVTATSLWTTRTSTKPSRLTGIT